jgi:hypothetical protein
MDKAYLHIAVIGSPRFARVYKSIRRLEDVELSAHIPEVTYSALGFEQAKNALETNGFSTGVGAHDGCGGADDLVVNCGPGISRAVVLIELLFRDLLQLDLQRQCVAHIEHGHPNPWAHPGFATRPGT